MRRWEPGSVLSRRESDSGAGRPPLTLLLRVRAGARSSEKWLTDRDGTVQLSWGRPRLLSGESDVLTMQRGPCPHPDPVGEGLSAQHLRHLLHICKPALSVLMQGPGSLEPNELIQTSGLYSRLVLVPATGPTSTASWKWRRRWAHSHKRETRCLMGDCSRVGQVRPGGAQRPLLVSCHPSSDSQTPTHSAYRVAVATAG